MRRKQDQMKETELRRKFEREQLTRSVELKKRKIVRESVEDDLDRSGFESRHERNEAVSSKESVAAKKRR